ncbi:MAG: hypothetical protein IJY87_05980 [Bacilli bacterium]|nr:hypothetical protein [Bacilli bacterium]
MKYFKYSIMLLVISIIANYTFTFAYTADELPVSGSVSLNWKDAKTTSIKNKTTSGDQKFKLRESSCSSCTYKISVFAGGIEVGEDTKVYVGDLLDFYGSGSTKGQAYAEMVSNKYTIINNTVGYTYDPNRLTL